MLKQHSTMKMTIIGAMMMAGLSACQNTNHAIGMSNPASDYCIKQGGQLILQKDAQGNEYALCKLPNGEVIEEWEFYRKNHK